MSLRIDQRQVGPLNCAVVDPEEQTETPQLAVVLCHGFGAPGTDLVGLAPEILNRMGNPDGIRFYFPQAPLAMDEVGMPGSRAWWMLNLELLAMAAEGLLERDMRDETPDGLVAARELLAGTVEMIQAETGLPAGQIVMGGFSQGSMVATDLALRIDERPAALIVYSGTLLCQSEWRAAAEKRGPLKVLQSHGRQDMILPFRFAEDLSRLLSETGGEVEFIPFDGPHTIPQPALEKTVTLLQGLLHQ
jgi:phospholipase/carboxylesterase